MPARGGRGLVDRAVTHLRGTPHPPRSGSHEPRPSGGATIRSGGGGQPSGGREQLDQRLRHNGDLLAADRPALVHTPREPARIEEPEALDGQGTEQRDAAAAGLAVGVDEAEAAGDGHVGFDQGKALADRLDLTAQALDQLGLIAASDAELLGAEERLSDLDLALEALGVDDEDARGRSGSSVLIRRCFRDHRPVVELTDEMAFEVFAAGIEGEVELAARPEGREKPHRFAVDGATNPRRALADAGLTSAARQLFKEAAGLVAADVDPIDLPVEVKQRFRFGGLGHCRSSLV